MGAKRGGGGGKRRGSGRAKQGSSSRGRRGKGPAKLTQKDREHIGEFGEEHPVAEFGFGNDVHGANEAVQPDTSRNLARVITNRRFRDSRQGKAAAPLFNADKNHADSLDLDEVVEAAEPAYARLLSTLKRANAMSHRTKRARIAEQAVSAEPSSDFESFSSDGTGDEEALTSHEDDSLTDQEDEASQDDLDALEDDADHNEDVDEDDNAERDEEEEEDDDENEDDNEHEDDFSAGDPWHIHFEETTGESIGLSVKDSYAADEHSDDDAGHLPGKRFVSRLGKRYDIPFGSRELDNYWIKKKLSEHWKATHNPPDLLPQQSEFLFHLSHYRDIFWPARTADVDSHLRDIYCVHALNHVLKARARILRNNERLREAAAREKDIGEVRDQGFTRPKVLIVAPMRNAAYDIVNRLLMLSGFDNGQVMNKKRFKEEFGPSDDDEQSNKDMPPDYRALFDGNTDDCFSLTMNFTRKVIKLFSPMYRSDIIIASPLALRMLVGSKGDKSQDYDVLSSIEVVIWDQTDVFLMQNWDHVVHVADHINLLPKEQRDTDFSRLKEFYINGLARHFRQTIVLSQFLTPEIQAFMARHATSFEGKVKYIPEYKGTIRRAVGTTHVLQRFSSSSVAEVPDARFQFFIDEVLAPLKVSTSSHVLIFVPSYFDFVRLRNYMKKAKLSFAHISEYSLDKDISRARTYFFHGRRKFLLVSERFYFYRRYKLRGVRHVIFYGLPTYPDIYPDFVNSMEASAAASEGEDTRVTVLYCRYDALRLERIFGTSQAKTILSSTNDVHLFK